MSIIIGIDHGYYAIKTAHCSFPAGLTSYGEHEPYTRQGLLEFGGCFFVCGSGRQPTPAFCSRSVMICNVVVESACIGIPKRINGTVVTVECGRIEFAQKNSLSNFVKSYSGFVGIMKESALHRAQAISTPSNLPG